MVDFRVFIQARMTSSRFPGKVLAPLRGRPVINHVINRLSKAVSPDSIVVATSTDVSDDPLVAYLANLGTRVFRGPLENVFRRFQLCLEAYPCSWFVRICADSPLLDSKLISMMLPHADAKSDLITNVQMRTFPRGQSVELINAQTFAGIEAGRLSAAEREHATQVFYADPVRYRIINLVSGDPSLARQNFVVDTIEDLHRLEQVFPREASAW
jgi:spore coat polysaccharide biosynthesis protein SpsF